MRRVLRFAVVGLILLGAESGQTQVSSSKKKVSCGGELEIATVERYFSDLRKALQARSPPSRFNEFVDDIFGITDRSGHTLYFKRKDFNSITPGRITLEEWKEISRRGARGLHNAGWRGCFLDSGKVAFEGGGDTFVLRHISRDMPWKAIAKGDLLP